MMAAQKINEAHEHIAKAEKCLKTSFTKWKPDYDSAASEYAKAAVAFKNAKQFEQAKDAYVKEAEYHTENKALFHAAKALEQAGMMMKDMKRMGEAIQYIEKASMMYVENGTPDTAAMALDRAGKLIEPVSVEKAVDLYQKAASVFEKTIAQVLVHLHRSDFVAAEKCVRESYSIPGFSGSEDCAAMEQLLQGYDEQDEDVVNRVCNSPLLKYMDNDYAKLAVTLKVPGGGKKKKPPAAPQGGAGGSQAAAEEDDYEGGLC
ncbi:N-ethylmaleimide-sensitive factor attachment protein, gamma b isoform X2 [Scleropages formosus]|uniref:N-ethylmaleimide-sensitive factor attachment protein, gamma b isoform X2 n=1 Tax=Scleropages formosus TaxID=113540 RepID=UPI000877EDFD|nr:gamma-soluble NSF attachment protein isoform X2 [Scleropages formosus]